MEVLVRVERQEKNKTRGDRARGMQDDTPVTQYRRGSGGDEKTAGNGKGGRREKVSVILKLESSAWETQGLSGRGLLAPQWLSTACLPLP